MQDSRLARWLVDAGLTLTGVIAAVTPLALWVAWSELVFNTVLSVGCGAFLVFMGLARLRGYLIGDEAAEVGVYDPRDLQQRRVDWEEMQEDDPAVRQRQLSIKGDAKREFGFMLRVTFGLILGATALFLLVWLGFEVGYG